ncbi:hypothetical protein MRX96_057839 [Rhipicephalus microplus]
MRRRVEASREEFFGLVRFERTARRRRKAKRGVCCRWAAAAIRCGQPVCGGGWPRTLRCRSRISRSLAYGVRRLRCEVTERHRTKDVVVHTALPTCLDAARTEPRYTATREPQHLSQQRTLSIINALGRSPETNPVVVKPAGRTRASFSRV